MGLMKTDIEKIENRIQIFEQENPNPVMSKEKQIEKFKKICKEYNIPDDLLDLNMLVDRTLTFEENKTQILPLIETLASSQNAEEKIIADKKVKKKSIREEKLEQERINFENLKREEENAKEELNEAISNIVKDKKSNLNKYFEPLKEYLKAVVNSDGYLNSLFVHSPAGLGKTTITLSTLKELKKNFVYISNYTTDLEFVNFLYQNSDKIIVLDDFEDVLKIGSKIINILKGTLWGIGKENKRIVSYLTTSKLLKAPKQFEFNGKLIFLLNRLPNEQDTLIKALLSRSIVYSLNFTYSEIMEILAEFSKIPYKTLTEAQRKEIYSYLKQNTDESVDDLNFRTMLKIYDLYINNPKNWKELSKIFFKRDERIALLKSVLKKCSTITEAQKEFCEQSGLSRASFFNIKRSLKVY